MSNKKAPEVLVAGAGPVGLFAALALAKRGISVRIVDTGVWACKHSYALALHPESVKLLQEVGLTLAAGEAVRRISSVGIYDAGGRRALLQPGEDGAVVRQDFLEDLLEKALGELGVEVEWRHEISRVAPAAGHVEVTVDRYQKQTRGYVVARSEWMVADSSTLQVPYLIGADGYNSVVRRALGAGFPEVAPAQYYAVFEFSSDTGSDEEMRIVLGDGTTDVLWPLPHDSRRWSFELPGYSDPRAEAMKDRLLEAGLGYFPTSRVKDRALATAPESLPVLEEESLRALLAERAPWFKGTIDTLAWRTVVRFERRLASSFGRDRLWLAGDSAHLAGPVGIQSMNVGLLEANDLAGRLARVLRDAGPADELSRYNERWTSAWRVLHGMGGGLRAGAQTDAWVAARAGSLLSCLPASGRELGRLAGQLGLEEAAWSCQGE